MGTYRNRAPYAIITVISWLPLREVAWWSRNREGHSAVRDKAP